MGFEKYLDITPEIKKALSEGKPVVGLESTILSHGMPYPQNKEFAANVEKIVREAGAVPATTAIIGGKLKVGLSEDELMMMCNPKDIGKVSRRDVATYLATGKTGATTVATTMLICSLAGIKIFATGGIGGVHRRGEDTMDISADLQELANTPVCVVGAGAKSLLDIGRTLEYLETFGVPVLGFGTDYFPAFYCESSGYKVDYNCRDAAEAARIIYTKWDLGLKGGLLIGNPIPHEYALDYDEMDKVICKAIEEADAAGVRGKDITPFLLSRIKDMTEGVSFASNLQLAYNNARVASSIAVELSKLG